MIASCDDDGAVSGLDRSRWGHPTRREAASVFPRLGGSRDGEANSFSGRAGPAPGALSKAIAHHLRRHGRGCSRAIARCLPIRACVASAGRFVEWSSVVRYSIFHRKTLVRKNQVSQSGVYSPPLFTSVHGSVIDARHVHRAQRVPPPRALLPSPVHSRQLKPQRRHRRRVAQPGPPGWQRNRVYPPHRCPNRRV